MEVPFRKAFLTGLAGLVLLMGAGIPFVKAIDSRENEEFRKSTLSLAVAYASMLSQFDLESLREDSPPNDVYFHYLNESLRRWMVDQPHIQSMYAMRKDNQGRNYFILGPETDYDGNGIIEGPREQMVPLGTLYTEYVPELEEAFLGKSTMQKTPTEDEWGLSMSAFAPVKRNGGRVIAVVGIDLDGSEVLRQVRMERLKGYFIILFPYCVILAVYILYVRRLMERRILSDKQSQLSRQEEKYRTLSDSSVEGLVIHRQGIIQDVNHAFCRLFGYDAEELVGKSVFLLIHPEDHSLVQSRMDSSETEVYRVKGIHKDGTIRDLELHVNLCLYNGEASRAVAVRDITEQKQQEETIYRLAYYDDLTGLPNKKRFLRSLNRWLTNAGERKAAVFFMDLNKFKPINDSFGHSAGDAALKECAQRMMRVLPKNGKIARWGGDEFVALLPDVSGRAEAANAAKLFVEALDKPVYCNGIPVKIGTSLGISLYPEDGTDAETLLRKADTAMFTGKRVNSKAIQFFDTSLQEKAESRVRMEQELRTALAEGQFELYYQPQVMMETGQITGAEALIRWRHPQRGHIPPVEFIPLAEETGLILDIGEWVLRQACQDMRQMREEGLPPMRIAVNLSALQFAKEDLAETVGDILEEAGLPARQLELEITETMMMDPDHALSILLRLKGLGVRISIDDFGTGFSSLHYLNRFPIDKVKIDRSFITDLDGGEAPITTAIVSLARTLRLETIAEGVETSLQAEQLIKLGCSVAQGYLYYKPLSKEQFLQVLRSRAAG